MIAGVIMIIIALWILATNVTWVSFAISLLLIAVGGFLISLKEPKESVKRRLKMKTAPRVFHIAKSLTGRYRKLHRRRIITRV